MSMNADLESELESNGYAVAEQVIPQSRIEAFKAEILCLGNYISKSKFADIDEMYSYFKKNEPYNTGLIYDACKRMVGLYDVAYHPGLLEALRSAGSTAPANIDVNFRIDSKSREKYLFGWHQDYWFSMGSRNGIVAWLPLTDIDPEIGGLDVISYKSSGRKIYKVQNGRKSDSYADMIELDERIPDEDASSVRVRAGDALLFRFDVLHRSLPILSELRSRWTVQARYCDFEDDEFRANNFRTASVSKDNVPYLDYLAQQRRAGEKQ